jgi:putative ABC transport system substrate-binding protein
LLDKILNGTNAGELPFERSTRFTFAVNLKTAAKLGLVLPPALVGRADEVIE